MKEADGYFLCISTNVQYIPQPPLAIISACDKSCDVKQMSSLGTDTCVLDIDMAVISTLQSLQLHHRLPSHAMLLRNAIQMDFVQFK